MVCAYCHVERRLGKDAAEAAYGEYHRSDEPFSENATTSRE